MKLLIAVLLAVFSTGAMAEWTYLTSSEDNAYDIYIDKTAIHKRGNVAKVWSLHDYKAPQGEKKVKPYLSVRGLSEYDCVEIRIRLSSITFFSDNMGSGQVTFSHQNNEGGTWNDIAPGTVDMSTWQVACKK